MEKSNRIPTLMALGLGLVLLAMLPAANQLAGPGGIPVTWTVLAVGEGILLLFCAWAQLSRTYEVWTRTLGIIAFLVAIYVGVDLNESYNAQHAYDTVSRDSVLVASNSTPTPKPKSHYHYAKSRR